MILREVTLNDEQEILDMYNEYKVNEVIEGMDRFEGIRPFEKLEEMSFKDWLKYLEENKYEENLPTDYAPHTFYVVVVDEKIVGGIDIRWKMVPALSTHGGLIGYSIRPSMRGKGYATEMLKLGLLKFKDTDFDKILITCKDFNTASKKVIEKNGGEFINNYPHTDGFNYLRYYIKIK